MVMIGKKVPNFSCKAVVDGQVQRVSLDDYAGSYKILFFYPKDFTFVCPTELHALQEHAQAFKERNTVVLGCSTDPVERHVEWLKTPKDKGGVAGVEYPLLADESKQLAQAFGVLDEQEGIAVRGMFVLDKNNVLQAAMIYNCGFGRNIAEVLRVLDAMRHVEEYGDLCPVGWRPGDAPLKPTQESVEEYFARDA